MFGERNSIGCLWTAASLRLQGTRKFFHIRNATRDPPTALYFVIPQELESEYIRIVYSICELCRIVLHSYMSRRFLWETLFLFLFLFREFYFREENLAFQLSDSDENESHTKFRIERRDNDISNTFSRQAYRYFSHLFPSPNQQIDTSLDSNTQLSLLVMNFFNRRRYSSRIHAKNSNYQWTLFSWNKAFKACILNAIKSMNPCTIWVLYSTRWWNYFAMSKNRGISVYQYRPITM